MTFPVCAAPFFFRFLPPLPFGFLVHSFLVDACMKLLAHVETEGLFRKSGSVVRLKALRVSDAWRWPCPHSELLTPRLHSTTTTALLKKKSQRHNRTLFCLLRPNWLLARSACPRLCPATWPAWSSSSSGSFLSPCCPRSCRRPFSRPSSSPARRRGPPPPRCCPACCQTGTSPPSDTSLTSSRTCLQGSRITQTSNTAFLFRPSPIVFSQPSVTLVVLQYYSIKAIWSHVTNSLQVKKKGMVWSENEETECIFTSNRREKYN